MLLDWLLLLRDPGEKDFCHFLSILCVYAVNGRGYVVTTVRFGVKVLVD